MKARDGEGLHQVTSPDTSTGDMQARGLHGEIVIEIGHACCLYRCSLFSKGQKIKGPLQCVVCEDDPEVPPSLTAPQREAEEDAQRTRPASANQLVRMLYQRDRRSFLSKLVLSPGKSYPCDCLTKVYHIQEPNWCAMMSSGSVLSHRGEDIMQRRSQLRSR
jgi:hypothetical protein